MKNATKNNFTKLTLKKGISLIVLIVTIIVIIILATVIVLTISENNPISLAKEATFKEDMKTFQNELNMAIYEEYAQTLGKRKETITTSDFAKIQEYIPSVTEKYKGKFIIQKDKIVYVKKKLTNTEINWLTDIEIYEKLPDAEIVGENPKKYYGEDILNYSTGNKNIDNQVGWKIFYSDGNNIYLITSDYIHYDICPASKNYKLHKYSDYTLGMGKVVGDYNGSVDIKDTRLQELNSSYFNYLKENNTKSENNNMKAVAYMLDTSIWNVFSGERAEYAIGGPTLEMLIKSYSQKYEVEYIAEAKSVLGYEISNNGGKTWNNCIKLSNITDILYVISDTTKSTRMWLASPSNLSHLYVETCRNNGDLVYAYYFEQVAGFRPIVCLESNVILKQVDGGFEIE